MRPPPVAASCVNCSRLTRHWPRASARSRPVRYRLPRPAGLAERQTRWSQTPCRKGCGFESHTRHPDCRWSATIRRAHVRRRRRRQRAARLGRRRAATPRTPRCTASPSRRSGGGAATTSAAAGPRPGASRGAVPALRRRRARRAGLRRAARLVPRRRPHLRGRRGGLRPARLQRPRATPRSTRDVADLMRRVKPGGRPHTRVVPGCVVMTVVVEALAVPVPAARARAASTSGRSCSTAWQREIVEAHPADFLRGLFHSDGCRVEQLGHADGGRRAEALRLPALAVHEPLRGHPRLVLLRRSTSSTSPWRRSNCEDHLGLDARRRRPARRADRAEVAERLSRGRR